MEINKEIIKERKRKYKTVEEAKQAHKEAMKRYQKNNREKHKENVRVAALKCYYKNKEKGISKAMEYYKRKHPNYGQVNRGRKMKPKEEKEEKEEKIIDEKEKYKKIKKSELIDKIIALSNLLNNQ